MSDLPYACSALARGGVQIQVEGVYPGTAHDVAIGNMELFGLG
jgi:hypothetical protein